MTSDYPPPPPPQQPGQYGYPGSYPPPGGRQEPGSLGLRFAARILDGLIVGIVGGIIVYAIGLASNVWITGLFTGVITFAYYVGLEVTQGWTLGKKVLGLSVHGPGGAPKPTVRSPRSATRGRCCRSCRSSAACSVSSRSSSSR